MPRHLISGAHEWINEIPTVPIYYLAKPQPRERTWEDQRGKKTLLSLTLVDPKAHPLHARLQRPKRTLPTNRTSSNSGQSQTPFVPVSRESAGSALLSRAGQCLFSGSYPGSVHLSNDNAGVLRPAQ